MKADYLIVGAGLFGAVFAREAARAGKTVAVIDRRDHIGGNVYTENRDGINVHVYGAHIFHTSDKKIWEYINQFAEFNNYINSPIAIYNDELYNLPFNMNTFSKMWNIKTPAEAKAKIEEQRRQYNITEPKNLEEQALSLAGRDVYEKLIKGYTQKQWGRPCTELPAFIIKRLPFRFTYDNNYFNDRYQGIPIGGYTRIVEKMLAGIPVFTGQDFIQLREEQTGTSVSFSQTADLTNHDSCNNIHKLVLTDGTEIEFDRLFFTGQIDEYYNYCCGPLAYRSVRFETEELDTDNFQGNAVVNYTSADVPYTRIIEHKHFEFGTQPVTIISREYSSEWKPGVEPYYPVNDEKNSELYRKYRDLAAEDDDVIFGGRLGMYKYYNMDQVIAEALKLASAEL